MTVAAIVPARNEAERVGATVNALRLVERIDEIIVVDDASSDDTPRRAREAGAHVITLRARAGKGAALAKGVGSTTAEILCFIDADLGDTASVAKVLLEPLLTDEADMTIAKPPADAPSGFGMVERFARWAIHATCGATMARPLSGQRAVRRTVIERTGIARGFGVETALTIDAIRAGFHVVEIPFPIEHAKTRRDLRGFLHRAKQGADILTVLAPRIRHR